jgi:hypothetical protein
LFLSPPLFVLSGLGLQAIYRRLRIAWRYALFVVILLLPGIFACIQLHPYQYVYYNALVGGTAGAFRRYEMDYWATSYEDATEYLNRTAPQGSIVVVWGADHLVSAVARPDLQVQEYRKAGDWEPDAAVYAVLSTRHDKDLSLYPDAEVLYQVSRAGAVFAVVKQLQPGSAAQP